MTDTFAVIRSRGPAWDDTRPLCAQADWDSHARFMDDLTAAGFIVMGGPLTGSREVLLIVTAESAQHVRETLKQDPWEAADLLTTESVRHWTILLEARPGRPDSKGAQADA